MLLGKYPSQFLSISEVIREVSITIKDLRELVMSESRGMVRVIKRLRLI